LVSIFLCTEQVAGEEFLTFSPATQQLSLRAEETPLQRILDGLDQQGVDITIDPQINPAISLSLVNEPLEKALARILKGFDYTLVWLGEGQGSREIRIAAVEVVSKSQGRIEKGQSPHLPLILADDNGRPYVKDRLVILLEDTTLSPQLLAELERFGILRVEHQPGTSYLAVTLSETNDPRELSKFIARLEGVEAVEPDYVFPLEGPTVISEDALVVEQVPRARERQGGSLPTVAVLDSGLHPDYMGNPLLSDTYDATSSGWVTGDPLGHGTQMSLIASGEVAPLAMEELPADPASVLSIKVVDQQGLTSTSTLIEAINYATNSNARVMSLSWGMAENSVILEHSFTLAAENGLVILAAAGNEATGSPVYPAALDKVIGVGALNPDGTVWEKSNYGESVDLYAPGMANLPVGYEGQPGIYAGTSIATAYAARTAAHLLKTSPELEGEALLEALANELYENSPEVPLATH
jgi:hypothetical protein